MSKNQKIASRRHFFTKKYKKCGFPHFWLKTGLVVESPGVRKRTEVYGTWRTEVYGRVRKCTEVVRKYWGEHFDEFLIFEDFSDFCWFLAIFAIFGKFAHFADFWQFLRFLANLLIFGNFSDFCWFLAIFADFLRFLRFLANSENSAKFASSEIHCFVWGLSAEGPSKMGLLIWIFILKKIPISSWDVALQASNLPMDTRDNERNPWQMMASCLSKLYSDIMFSIVLFSPLGSQTGSGAVPRTPATPRHSPQLRGRPRDALFSFPSRLSYY